MRIKPTFQIVLDTRRIKKDNTYPVKLRLTYNRRSKYYNTGHSFSESVFNSMMGSKPRGLLKNNRIEINAIEKRAKDIIEEIGNNFSFELFEKKFQTNPSNYQNIYIALNSYVTELEKEKRFSSANTYKFTAKAFKNFTKKEILHFNEITPKFLRQFQKFMLGNGKSITTVGIYLRNYRTIINKAINEGIISKDLYPFGKGKYTIPRGKNPKKALAIGDIEKIYKYKPTFNNTKQFSKDIWIFSYLCNGMNIKDILNLKYKDIQNGYILFKRAKTINTSGTSKTIEIHITKEIGEILDTWGTKPKYLDNYVFPVLNNELSELEKYKIIINKTGVINKNMKNIAKELGIESSISTYTARHSFATILKRSGVNVSFISDALGHQSIKTTENYLAGFEDDAKKEIAKKLVDFG